MLGQGGVLIAKWGFDREGWCFVSEGWGFDREGCCFVREWWGFDREERCFVREGWSFATGKVWELVGYCEGRLCYFVGRVGLLGECWAELRLMEVGWELGRYRAGP